MGDFLIGQNHRFHFLLAICLLLGLTNATNTTVTNDNGIFGKVSTVVEQVWTSISSDVNGNLTSNESQNASDTSIFHKPKNIGDVERIFTAILRVFSQLLIIFGGIIPYIPQYLIIKRTQNAEGFSNYVCLTLLVANIIRIEFWFGKHFETPLLIQSIIMILCMLVMLELCTRVYSKSLRHNLPINQQKDVGTEYSEKNFTDFQVEYFWKWTNLTSYIQFLCLFTFLLSTTTWLFLDNTFYIETIGFLAVFFEALLGTPQFLRNYRLKSTEGMSIKMVLMWTSGDIFKTVYFLVRHAPTQFWLCGALQISIDIAILCQVMIYSKNNHPRKP